MMKQRWLKLFGMMVAISMMISGFSVEVRAENMEETEIEVPCRHTTVNTETEAAAVSDVLQRGAYLSGGSAKITDKGNSKINVYGKTDAYQVCDKLYLNIYLEQSEDGVSWDYYNSWSYTASNVATLTKSFTITVDDDYYYRLRGYHAAKEGSVKESTSTRTSGLYIN